jgi:uncharacterized protein YjbJ (UPF0337 family)
MMNTDTLKGSWTELKGKIKQRWGKITDDDLALIEGKMDELGGIVQKRYGIAKDDARKQADEFLRDCGC